MRSRVLYRDRETNCNNYMVLANRFCSEVVRSRFLNRSSQH